MNESAPWAPQCIAGAFRGVARRTGELDTEEFPVFDWAVAVSSMRAAGIDTATAAETACDQRAIWLIPVNRSEYWKSCRQRNMRVWEGLQPACLGIGIRNGQRTAVYSKRQTLHVLEAGFVDAGVTMQASTIRLRATDQFNEILNVYLGASTPFFLP